MINVEPEEIKQRLKQIRSAKERLQETRELLKKVQLTHVAIEEAGKTNKRVKAKLSRVETAFEAAVAKYVHDITEGLELINCIEVRDKCGRMDYKATELRKTILEHKYIMGERWEVIAGNIAYSWRQTCRLHDDALKNIAKNINKNDN